MAEIKWSYRSYELTEKNCSLPFTFSVEGTNKFLQSNSININLKVFSERIPSSLVLYRSIEGCCGVSE